MTEQPEVNVDLELDAPIYDELHDLHPPRPAKPNRAPHKSLTQIAAEVHAGWWGHEDGRAERLDAAGFDSERVLALVERGVGKTSAESLGAKPSY